MSPDGTYTDDEVRAIIDRALRTDLNRQVTHEELVAVAAEVGLSREAVERAAREVQASREIEAARQRVLRARRRGLWSHVSTYLIVNLFLFAINFLTSPGEWWALFPILGWGLGVVFHMRSALSNEVSDRELAKAQRKLRAERRLLEPSVSTAPGLSASTDELSAAIQDRVGRILAKAAAELRSETTGARPRVRLADDRDQREEELERDDQSARRATFAKE